MKVMISIKLFVYDFDGVMTNNKVFVDQHGNEMVQVNRADGLGILEIKKRGFKQIIFSTEKNPVITMRAKKLDIPCIQGIVNKKAEIVRYCRENKFPMDKVAYLGNDLNDKEAMEAIGITFCPADAHESIIEISDHVLNTKGGDGVIRELLDLISK